jgi:hypothetical protein
MSVSSISKTFDIILVFVKTLTIQKQLRSKFFVNELVDSRLVHRIFEGLFVA